MEISGELIWIMFLFSIVSFCVLTILVFKLLPIRKRDINNLLKLNLADVKYKWNNLTPREKEIAMAVFYDMSTTQIAEKYFISENAVKEHKKNIFRKLQINKVTQLIKIIMLAES